MHEIDDIRRLIQEAAEQADQPSDIYERSAREIVNIERQSYYGDDSSQKRLAKIREHFSDVVKRELDNEA